MFFNVLGPGEDYIITEDYIYVLSFKIWPEDLHETSELWMERSAEMWWGPADLDIYRL